MGRNAEERPGYFWSGRGPVLEEREEPGGGVWEETLTSRIRDRRSVPDPSLHLLAQVPALASPSRNVEGL